MKKKTCKECKAFENGDCALGYKVKTHRIKTPLGDVTRGNPLEDCEKPLTTKRYVELLLKKKK